MDPPTVENVTTVSTCFVLPDTRDKRTVLCNVIWIKSNVIWPLTLNLYMALTPYGGWHREDKDSAESWTRRTTHTGDSVGYYEFDQRFEHPGRTWASATHRAFSFACVGAAMANETWKFVQAKSKQAMKQVLDIKDEAAPLRA